MWKEYKDGYYFSNFGRVKHVYKNGNVRLLKPFTHNTGVILIKIHCKSHTVSRIVYELFEGPIPEGYSILHKNRIRSDNSIANLKLATKNEMGRYSGYRASRKKLSSTMQPMIAIISHREKLLKNCIFQSKLYVIIAIRKQKSPCLTYRGKGVVIKKG